VPMQPSLSARRATCASGQAARPRARSFAMRPSRPAGPSALAARQLPLAARTHWRGMPNAPGWREPRELSVPAARRRLEIRHELGSDAASGRIGCC
jgi:hypothetical protein